MSTLGLKMIFRHIDFNEDKACSKDIINLFARDLATNTSHFDDQSPTENLFFVIENNNGVILGAAEARIEDKHILKLLNFTIHPNHRNQGLGSYLLTAFEDYVKGRFSLQVTIIKLLSGGK
jgi:ribosomal protein S18 acetylase RimI-like enzyme